MRYRSIRTKRVYHERNAPRRRRDRDEAERLLREGTLEQIEERLGEVTGSGRADPLFVVCPPM